MKVTKLKMKGMKMLAKKGNGVCGPFSQAFRTLKNKKIKGDKQ